MELSLDVSSLGSVYSLVQRLDFSTSWRKASKSIATKTVANTNINFTDKDINRNVKKFHVWDGLDDEEVAKQSRNHRRWGF